MAKPFSILRNKMSPDSRKRAEAKTKELLKEMQLQDLRLQQNFSQESIAESLSTKQANISRLEKRSDMYVSTLKNYVEALGGKLDIIARFPDGDVYINQFDDGE